MASAVAPSQPLVVKHLGIVDYVPVWQAMKDFTQQRGPETADEIWLLQHKPVFTQGQAGKAEHILAPGDIPVVQVDRGGQVTYHGPGQLVAYLLIDIKRLGIGVRQLVTVIEQGLVTVLAQQGIVANPRADAPGVYVASGAKIAQLGLRVSKGRSFHGLSLNIDMDMQPFARINPCGYAGMAVTNMAQELNQPLAVEPIAEQLLGVLMADLGYNASQII
ncbi:lipoyl(octanoyl) transferase LipB [Dasania marina]|uniref:lipoyl(octanoyl) transferase LipB n=1 Tax=Dasania marina TaxID=471499 RepID=UPI0030D7001D|tara:strand:+ start:17437 stop:18093 length:657 start_codon:yes stop_codon:yes gene_type:complete